MSHPTPCKAAFSQLTHRAPPQTQSWMAPNNVFEVPSDDSDPGHLFRWAKGFVGPLPVKPLLVVRSFEKGLPGCPMKHGFSRPWPAQEFYSAYCCAEFFDIYVRGGSPSEIPGQLFLHGRPDPTHRAYGSCCVSATPLWHFWTKPDRTTPLGLSFGGVAWEWR